MVIKVYISGISGNKEVKKRQQRVLLILDSKNVKYEVIDIAEPGAEEIKDFMQNNCTASGATISDPTPRHPLPPQIFNEDDYCGDYDMFDMANEIDEMEKFLKLEPNSLNEQTSSVEIKLKNGDVSIDEKIEKVAEATAEPKENEVPNDQNEAEKEGSVEKEDLIGKDDLDQKEVSVDNEKLEENAANETENQEKPDATEDPLEKVADENENQEKPDTKEKPVEKTADENDNQEIPEEGEEPVEKTADENDNRETPDEGQVTVEKVADKNDNQEKPDKGEEPVEKTADENDNQKKPDEGEVTADKDEEANNDAGDKIEEKEASPEKSDD